MKECCKTYLDEQFGGDADIVGDIYNEYVSSVAEKLAEAEEALSASAWDRLDKVAHAVKGNALAAGDTEMADTAIALRGAAKLSDTERAGSLIAHLRELQTQLS